MDFIKEKLDFYLLDTQIENMFINEYMPFADGNYVKVYLFALMYADKSSALTNDTIAKHLKMEIEDVLKAWSYWEKQGVIKKKYKSKDNPFDYVVEFISLKQLFVKSVNKGISSQPSVKKSTASVFETAMENENIKKMFDELQGIIGRPFEGNEMFEIIDWIDHYKMDPQLITQAYTYDVNKKNNNSFKYIASIVRNWFDNKVKTIDDLENYFEKTDKRYTMYKRVLKSLGLNFRYPTEEEKRLMDTWFDEYHFDMETILKACKKTASISNPNISYINTILKNWHKKENSPTKDSSAFKDKSEKVKSTKKIFDAYKIIRKKNENIHDKRRFEIYKKIPRIKLIDEQISQLSISISKSVLMSTQNSKDEVYQLKKKISQLYQEKAFLLTENNYPADYLEMIYECKVCNDTGLLDNGNHCECFDKKLAAK
ncbi:MAG: DnaD domain protein [Clostridia bacterium]|nr:DnaD domain protein [Clostridia bacterium]